MLQLTYYAKVYHSTDIFCKQIHHLFQKVSNSLKKKRNFIFMNDYFKCKQQAKFTDLQKSRFNVEIFVLFVVSVKR